MTRTLGVDFGRKRIGLAVSDADGRLASPLQQLDNTGDLNQIARTLRELIEEYEIDQLVIGLPLNMDDTVGPQAQKTRSFGDRLQPLLPVPLVYWDERLSSYTADQQLNQRDELTNQQRRRRRDALAAAAMLQSYLDQSPPAAPIEQTDPAS
ncbi:MAG: putative pre-16S rRNA nuclease [Phycisphaerae bacterium]|nr:putative pre-16S rRNA nuclease [Phycisphaerae bacterium]